MTDLSHKAKEATQSAFEDLYKKGYRDAALEVNKLARDILALLDQDQLPGKLTLMAHYFRDEAKKTREIMPHGSTLADRFETWAEELERIERTGLPPR